MPSSPSFDLARLPKWAFEKEDPASDAAFYVEPRFETHIDAAAIAALTELYREVLPPGGDLLDLGSSWISHLPTDVSYGAVVGQGMNAAELAANPQLTRWFTHDLNRDPVLPLASGSLGGATMCVSIQYLERPVEVLRDVRRTLGPGAPLVVSFSNRCFPTKAMAVWLALDGQGHAALVRAYLEAAGFSYLVVRRLRDGRAGDPMTAVIGRA